MSECVVFYSKDGNTEFVARAVAERRGAELVRLTETGKRGKFSVMVGGGFQAIAKAKSKLVGEPWEQAAAHDVLYLLTPIWASNGTPAINRFLDEADLRGKTCHLVTVQADPKKAGSEKALSYLSGVVASGGGRVASTAALHGASPGKFGGEEHLRRQLDQISDAGDAAPEKG